MNTADADWVTLAILGRTRGIRGEVTAIPLSDKPERFQSLRQAWLQAGKAQPRPVTVEDAWFHDRTLILKFKGIDSIEDAEPLSGAELRIPRVDRVSLDEGEYFQSDLIGCDVIDRSTGQSIGTVLGWQDGGGSGILELSDGLLIPFARHICVEIDPAARRIAVELPEGLRDLNRP